MAGDPPVLRRQPVADMVRLVAIGPRDLEAWWPRGVHLVQKWIGESWGEWSIPEVYDAIAARELQWWLAVDGEPVAMALTQILGTDSRKRCHILGIAGEDMHTWLPYLVDIEAWARQTGCTRLTGAGRPGWERVLKDKGFVRMYSVIVKELA